MLRLTSLLSRARITSSPALSQPGFRTPLARCATRASRAPIGPAQSSRARGGQFHSEASRLGPGNLDAEANDHFVVSTADPIEQPDPGRDLGDVVLDTGDERGDDLVDPVEVPAQTGHGLAGRGLGRSDPEVQS